MIEVDIGFVLIYTIVLIPIVLFDGWFAVWLYKRRQTKKDEQFLRYLKIRFPDSKDITFSSVASSDEEALRNVKEQLDEL